MENVRSSQPCISMNFCTELVKCNFFYVSIVKEFVRILKYRNSTLFFFLITPGLAWQAVLKKTKVKLDLLTDIHILIKVNGRKRS